MGIETAIIGGAVLGLAGSLLSQDSDIPELPSIAPRNIEEDSPEFEIGVDIFEGLSADEKRARQRLRTDIIQFSNNENSSLLDLTTGDNNEST